MLIVAGLHVPVTPLVEVTGKFGAVVFWQIGPIVLNVGVIGGLMVMLMVVARAH